MLHYERLKFQERETIYMGKLQGELLKSIARKLKRSPSTISRELQRNTIESWYGPVRAQNAAKERLARNGRKLEKYSELFNYVVEKLKIGWSPETIAGRLRRERKYYYICSESIYQFIYSKQGQRMGLYRHLVRKHPKRRIKCGRKPNKQSISDLVPISQRPEEVAQRTSIGHFEIDLIFFKGNQSANIITMVDRKSRFIWLAKSHSKRSFEVTNSIGCKLGKLPPPARKTATFDRGKEFAQHAHLGRQLNIATFFCNPHSPWQKGQVENANGRLRRLLPIDTHIKKLSNQCLQSIQNRMNAHPRKCLGYRTPCEVFSEELVQLNGGYCCG
jgi:IS30 family transposase